MHPSEALFQGNLPPAKLPVCDHYAGAEKLMRKSIDLQHKLGPVFDITLDCEDGAAAGNEEMHARLIASLVQSDDNRYSRIGVRVHDIDNCYFEQDIELICRLAATRLAYLVLPKVDHHRQVAQAIDLVNHHAQSVGRENLPIHVIIETHGSLSDVDAIAALPQVECLSFGIMDFVSAHYGAIPGSAMRSPGQFMHPLVARAKLEIAAACHSHGKVPSHNVTTELEDPTVIADDASRAAAEFGYTRMWSIHPSQIKPIIAAFSPCTTEVIEAANILTLAQHAQWGPIQVSGKLHDRASYRHYWTILQRAKMSGLPLPESAAALL